MPLKAGGFQGIPSKITGTEGVHPKIGASRRTAHHAHKLTGSIQHMIAEAELLLATYYNLAMLRLASFVHLLPDRKRIIPFIAYSNEFTPPIPTPNPPPIPITNLPAISTAKFYLNVFVQYHDLNMHWFILLTFILIRCEGQESTDTTFKVVHLSNCFTADSRPST